MPHGPYVINGTNIAANGALTLVQYKAGVNNPAEVIRVSVTQRGSVTSAQQPMQILRKSAAATVTAFTPLLKNTVDPAAAGAGSTSGTGVNASVEGTDGDILEEWDPNVLSGWLWVATPESRIWVPVSGIVAVKFPAAASPASSMNFDVQMEVREYP